MSSTERPAAPPPILVVEQDVLLGAPLVEQLVADGYPACLSRSREHARTLARAAPPRLLVLGELESAHGALELLGEVRTGGCPRADCSEVAHAAHSWSADLPVIVLGTRAWESDLLRAFEAGADDFIARPASYLELRARLRALLTRATVTRDSCESARSRSIPARVPSACTGDAWRCVVSNTSCCSRSRANPSAFSPSTN
jgi:DNA-binding response OmpR family regulator